MTRGPADSPYHRRLPVGEQVPADALVDDPMSSFEAVTLRALEPMLVPEQPRAGEEDRAACGHCRPSEHTIWHDDDWQVRSGFTSTGLPHVGGIAPREHVRLEDALPELLAGLGPLMQRVSAAVKAIPGVARCHFARWGDGSEHFHLWSLARPAGMMQGRGAMLAFWDDVLPPIPETCRPSTCGSSPSPWPRRAGRRFHPCERGGARHGGLASSHDHHAPGTRPRRRAQQRSAAHPDRPPAWHGPPGGSADPAGATPGVMHWTGRLPYDEAGQPAG